MKKKSLTFGFIMVLFTLTINLMADILTVGSGQTYSTITDAISAASDGDIIDVYGNITEAGIVVNKSLTIQGQGTGSTIVQAHTNAGSASDRVFEITSVGAVLIKDMTIQNGYSSGELGGGVYLNSVTTLNNCTLNDNLGFMGGGVYLDNGGSLINCTLSGNSGLFGGGVYFENGGTMDNCILSGNMSKFDGGGAYLYNGGSMYNCTLSGNTSLYLLDNDGGGAYLYYGGLLDNCTLSGNLGDYGGGVYFDNGGLLENCTLSGNSSESVGGGAYFYYGGSLNNCTLSGNSSENDGGGVYFYAGGTMNSCLLYGNTATGYSGGGAYLNEVGTMNNCLLNGNSAWYGGGAYLYYGGTMNNCTLSGNSAIEVGSKGGGVYLENDDEWYAYYDESILNNCIVWGNMVESTIPEDGNDIYVELDGTIRYTCGSDGLINGVDGCITDDPLFVNSDSDNFHLQASSPCINAGNNSYVIGDYDLDGNDRIQNGTVDMGAYEAGGMLLPEDVTILIADNIVNITWSTVSGATSYKIYSSDDPYTGFLEDTSGAFDGESWSASIEEVTKFYYVTATVMGDDGWGDL